MFSWCYRDWLDCLKLCDELVKALRIELELPLAGAIAVRFPGRDLETGDLDPGIEVVGYAAKQAGGQIVAHQLPPPRAFPFQGRQRRAVVDGEHGMVAVLDVDFPPVD